MKWGTRRAAQAAALHRKREAESMRWTRWFAWYPVRLEDSSTAWLEWVERKRLYPRTHRTWYYRSSLENNDGH